MNNQAAIGYMIMAANYLNLDSKTIKAMEEVMHEMMDTKSEDRAEKIYKSF